MKKILRLLLFGFLSWLLTFSASVCLFFLKKGNERLFETVMGIVLTSCTVLFTLLYFRKCKEVFFREGIFLGVAFVACNILFDLPMFMAGPMQMPLLLYLKEISIGYLNMPIISIGFGYALQKLRPQAINNSEL
jgi:hypothetical protein